MSGLPGNLATFVEKRWPRARSAVRTFVSGNVFVAFTARMMRDRSGLGFAVVLFLVRLLDLDTRVTTETFEAPLS